MRKKEESNQIRITTIVGSHSISLNITGTGNWKGVNSYFHTKRAKPQIEQGASEIVYLTINTNKIK